MPEKIKKIGFALVKITTEQFTLIESNFSDQAEIEIKIHFRFAADGKKRIVGLFLTLSYETNKKQFLIIEAACHFVIAPESWNDMLNQEQQKLTIPKKVLQHLAVITLGTTRGILHAKTENTCFNKYHLPTINVAEVIKKDHIFQFDQ